MIPPDKWEWQDEELDPPTEKSPDRRTIWVDGKLTIYEPENPETWIQINPDAAIDRRL